MTLAIGNDESRTVTANVSTTAIDHDGDIVSPEGVNLSVYVKNPVVMWAHNYSQPPIGKAKEINVSKDGRHFFATAERSLATEKQALAMFELFKVKFPPSEGYELMLSQEETLGRILFHSK